MRNGTTVRDVMHREFLGVSESDALGEAASLMVAEGADCLVVLRGSKPVGCLSPLDALGAVLDGFDPDETSVSDVMGPLAPTVTPDQRVDAAEAKLVAKESSGLVVTENGDAVGIVTERDVLAAGTTQTITAPAGEPHETGTESSVRSSSEDVTQSICELCGSLVANLLPSNGQLICADCRDI